MLNKYRMEALFLAMICAFSVMALAGFGDEDAPNENAQPEPQEPLNSGPMANDDANGVPPTDDGT